MSGYAVAMAAPGARRLLVSSLLGRLPLGMSLAILLLAKEATGSFGDAGVVVGAYGLASAVAGPLIGRLVDRVGQTSVLAATAVAQSALLVALVLAAAADAHLAALTALAAAAGCFIPPIAPCMRALWPQVVRDPAAREAAFSLDATAQEVIWTSGPLLVGGVIALVSPSAAVLLMAAVTIAGTAWFATAPLSRTWRPHADAEAGGALRSRGIRVSLICTTAAGLSIGAAEVGLPALAEELHEADLTGLLLAAASVGSAIGGIAYGARTWRVPLVARLAALLAGAALLAVPLLAAGSLPIAVAAALVSGMTWAPALSCTYALVARLAPSGAVTEAFTWSGATIGAGIALGVAVAGALVDAGGADAAFWLAIATAALAAAAALGGRRALTPAPQPISA